MMRIVLDPHPRAAVLPQGSSRHGPSWMKLENPWKYPYYYNPWTSGQENRYLKSEAKRSYEDKLRSLVLDSHSPLMRKTS